MQWVQLVIRHVAENASRPAPVVRRFIAVVCRIHENYRKMSDRKMRERLDIHTVPTPFSFFCPTFFCPPQQTSGQNSLEFDDHAGLWIVVSLQSTYRNRQSPVPSGSIWGRGSVRHVARYSLILDITSGCWSATFVVSLSSVFRL